MTKSDALFDKLFFMLFGLKFIELSIHVVIWLFHLIF